MSATELQKLPVKTPAIYARANWACTLPFDAPNDEIGIGFVHPDGSMTRLCLSSSSARHLCETLTNYLTLVHSPMSSESPMVDVSTPVE